MAVDLLGGERDGGERILDLVGDAAGDLFPGGLLLRAEEFGGVFEDEDVAVVLARWPVPGVSSSATVASRFMVLLKLPLSCGGRVSSISPEAEPMRWLRRMRRSRTSESSAGKTSSMGRAEEGTLAAGVHHLGEGAVGEDDAAAGVEGGDAVGDGLEHGLELAAAGFEGGVGGGELDGGVLDGAAAVFEIGGHVVEAADEFAEFFGGALGDAVGVVAGGDGLHGVGEGFDGLGDLLGEMQREPAGGEEREAGHHEQKQHVEIADLAALRIERSSRRRRRRAGASWWRTCRRAWAGRRRRCSPLLEAGGAEGVVESGRGRRRARRCAGRRRGWRRRWGALDRSSPGGQVELLSASSSTESDRGARP